MAKRLVERAPPVAPPPPRITRRSRAHTAAVADGNPNSGSEYHDEIWGNVWLTSFPAQTHSIYLLILHNSPFTFSYLHQQSSPSKNLVCFSRYHPSRSMRLPAVGLHSVHIQVLIGSLTSFSPVVSKMAQKNATCKYFLSRPSSCMYSVGLGLR